MRNIREEGNMKKFALAFLSLVMAFTLMIPVKATTNVAKIGDVEYETLEKAVEAVESTSFSTHQAPETPTTITLLEDTNAGIDIGK